MYAREEGNRSDDDARWSPVDSERATGAQERLMTGPFVRLLATNMAFGFSVSCFYLLPKHLIVTYAATPGQVGAVMGMFAAMSVIMAPWLGRLVSGFGLVRSLLCSQALLATSAFAFVFLREPGIAMLLVRALQGLAVAGVTTASVALVCELAPPSRLTRAMGLSGAASLVMNAIAPAVAEPIAARYGFVWVFVMSGFAGLSGAVLARRLPRQPRLRAPAVRVSVSPRARSVLAALIFSGAGFNVVITFLAPLALARGLSAVRMFFVAYTAAALCIRILGNGLTDRLGPRRMAMVGMLSYGLFIAAVAAVGPRSIAVLGTGFGLAHGVLFPTLMSLLFEGAAKAERARLAALSGGVLNLGMLSVLGFGQLANHFGLVSVFLTTGAFVASSAALIARAPAPVAEPEDAGAPSVARRVPSALASRD